MLIYSAVDNKNIPLQLKIDNLFNNKESGVFVELGANNGFNQSNTAFLEIERNWTGVLIEPSKINYEYCVKNRPNSKVYNYACVSKEYNNPYIYGDWEKTIACGTMASVGGKKLNSTHLELSKAKAATLEFILDKAKINNIDFLSLDTEGYEFEVLKGLNFEKYKPKYILIELYKEHQDKIISYLNNFNYSLKSNFSGYNKNDNPGWDGTHQDALFELK